MDSARTSLDFSEAMTRLCEDIADRMDEFQHIDMSRMIVTFAQARSRVSYGLQAKLTPMRFENGSLTSQRDGRLWTVERLYDGDCEMLYILTFYLPRFLDHAFREKMITIFHELYHVSPQFDGDIRRMSGRYHVHSHSQNEYDRQMGVLVDRYLQLEPPRDLLAFLRKRFRSLVAHHGSVVGKQIRIPRLIPLDDSRTA